MICVLNVTVRSADYFINLPNSFMPTINITLYGDIASHGGGKYIASLDLELPEGAIMDDLLQTIGLDPEDRGYLFINAILHDMPGLYASQETRLKEGDHVGIFSIRHMWPYQYRDGIRMSNALKEAMKERGEMRNTYRENPKN